MKKIGIIFLLHNVTILCAQNIVINNSFEEKFSCPTTGGNQMQYSVNWYSYRRSADYFNSCINDPTGFSVPINAFGYQLAATGNAYAGIFCYGSNAGDTVYREFIGGQLPNPLLVGQKYFVSFKINTPNTININCHSNNIGVLFSTVAYESTLNNNIEDNITNRAPVTNFAHIYSPTVITDTINWVTISGSFIADSMYRYIIVGNFFDNQHTSVIKTNSAMYCNSYYFVDDICVSTDSMTCMGSTGIKEREFSAQLTVYPNPSNSTFNIQLPNQQGFSLSITDITGRNIYENKNATNTITIDASGLSTGVYFVKAINQRMVLTGKMVKE